MFNAGCWHFFSVDRVRAQGARSFRCTTSHRCDGEASGRGRGGVLTLASDVSVRPKRAIPFPDTALSGCIFAFPPRTSRDPVQVHLDSDTLGFNFRFDFLPFAVSACTKWRSSRKSAYASVSYAFSAIATISRCKNERRSAIARRQPTRSSA